MITPSNWYDHLSNPWDPNIKNKFVVFKISFDMDESRGPEGKRYVYSEIGKLLKETERYEWFKQNDVDLNSIDLMGAVAMDRWQLDIIVVVDLPEELRTLYALRFY